jgi:predicted DNA-binding transcriptional regulator AlpA
MKILSYNECAERAGIARRSFERMIADGKGPPVVEITDRRRGVIEDDFNNWLLSRRRPVGIDPNPPKSGPGRQEREQ